MKTSQSSSFSQVGGNNLTRSSPSPDCSNSSSSSGGGGEGGFGGGRENNTNYSSVSASSRQDSQKSSFYIKRVQKKIREAGRTISSNSSSNACGISTTLTGLAGSCISQNSSVSRRPALNMSENNSTPGSGSRCSKKDACGSGAIYTATKGRPVRPKPAKAKAEAAALGGKSPAAVASLMSACAGATAKQAERLKVGGICQRDNPYASLGTETFRRLLQRTGGRRRRMRAGGAAGGGGRKRPKVKWCRPKVDECEKMQTQLCPNIGSGHTHGKLLEEVTPLLLRATQNLNCQLRELCRRLFFMRHNVPQLTAPALVNFHAILAEITRMLMEDFASFPEGLKLPDRNSNAA